MKLKLVLSLAVLAAGCASAPAPEQPAPAREAAPAAVDPVGLFDFTTSVEGTAVNGTITVTRNAQGGYGGTIATDVTETIPVRTVSVQGQTMTVVGDTPDGPVTIVLEFRGAEFSGNWTLAGMTGTHSGKRRGS